MGRFESMETKMEWAFLGEGYLIFMCLKEGRLGLSAERVLLYSQVYK